MPNRIASTPSDAVGDNDNAPASLVDPWLFDAVLRIAIGAAAADPTPARLRLAAEAASKAYDLFAPLRTPES